MPSYSMNHIHHEAKDVHAAAEWYKKLFGAPSDEPFERGGATWIRVHVGDVTVTITDREFTDRDLCRYQGYDHLALDTDDFDGTLARIEECGVEIFGGPMDAGGFRIVFVNGPDNVKIELMEKV
jgi:predicted enzyme related to lactoylglutathione lyase